MIDFCFYTNFLENKVAQRTSEVLLTNIEEIKEYSYKFEMYILDLLEWKNMFKSSNFNSKTQKLYQPITILT